MNEGVVYCFIVYYFILHGSFALRYSVLVSLQRKTRLRLSNSMCVVILATPVVLL